MVMGHSTGGLVAALWANRHPGELSGLVLNSPWLELQGSSVLRHISAPAVARIARFQPKAPLPNIDPGYYARTLSSASGGEWTYDTTWRPTPSFPVRAGWLQAIMAGHARVARGLTHRGADPHVRVEPDRHQPAVERGHAARRRGARRGAAGAPRRAAGVARDRRPDPRRAARPRPVPPARARRGSTRRSTAGRPRTGGADRALRAQDARGLGERRSALAEPPRAPAVDRVLRGHGRRGGRRRGRRAARPSAARSARRCAASRAAAGRGGRGPRRGS